VFENLTRFDIIFFPDYILQSCLFWKMNFVVFFGFLFHQFINISWSRYVGGLFGWFKYFLGCFFFYHFQFYPSKFDSLTLLGFAGVFFFKIFFFIFFFRFHFSKFWFSRIENLYFFQFFFYDVEPLIFFFIL
jgi:hypothetical protein